MEQGELFSLEKTNTKAPLTAEQIDELASAIRRAAEQRLVPAADKDEHDTPQGDLGGLSHDISDEAQPLTRVGLGSKRHARLAARIRAHAEYVGIYNLTGQPERTQGQQVSWVSGLRAAAQPRQNLAEYNAKQDAGDNKIELRALQAARQQRRDQRPA
jgi:hypothetical protein